MITETEDKLLRNELLNLMVTIKHSSNPLHEGINGVVVDETKNSIVIANGSKRRRIQKEYVIYLFSMPNGKLIEIDGRWLLGRPVDRIGKMPWRKKY